MHVDIFFIFRSYIRGQNIPVEPLELAERERRRQIAMEHQEAIRQQLEERENKRREEREKRVKEEREEELRIERERQIEKERKEIELKRLQEKQEKERKRKEALHEALKLAEKEAKEKKDKQKLLKQNINENITEKSKSPRKDELINNNINLDNNLDLTCQSTELNNANSNNHRLSRINEDDCNNNNNNKLNNKENNSDVEIKSLNQNNETINKTTENTPPPNSYRSLTPRQQLPTYRENLAFLVQTPTESLQGMQFAVLMPTFGSNFSQGIPIAVPVNLANETIATERTENRLLTPTIYRNKQFCNSSTQTEFLDYNKNDVVDHRQLNEKFSNMDLQYDNRNRRGKMRNDDRTACREVIEDRPKWGANRPPTRYLKQSEKDPLYQRRKLRQKIREVQVYRDKSNNYSPHSSDDSQTASPVTYRRSGYVEKRRSRALWRRNDHLFARNISVYQTEIIPLESDKDQIYYKSHLHKCCCQCFCEKLGQPAKNLHCSSVEHNLPSEIRCQLPHSMSCISNGD